MTRQRMSWTLATAAGVTVLMTAWAMKVRPILVYNVSASVPVGFYRVTRIDRLRRGDIVLVHTPETVRDLADRRRYLPRTVPMIKVISALAGDEVCAAGDAISINGVNIARRQRVDGLGRAMPQWFGCQVLAQDEVLLLNTSAPLSFDGRYFGVVKTRLIIGKVAPL